MGAESEALLADLGKRSVLSLWAYPNPYRDQGIRQRKEGKELCDLLVVFGRDVIIFSDKSCSFPSSGNDVLDWDRWYRRAVEASVKQIYGAERWIREHPDRIYLDRSCARPLPAKIPGPEEIRIHRVVVALGAAARCRQHFGDGSGSLPIRGGLHAAPSFERRDPFSLGDEGRRGDFVHVLDEVALPVLLRELDTAKDLIEYLSKKEDFFREHAVFATGEEDLLAHYLLTMGADNRHAFLDTNQRANAVSIDESAWPALMNLPQYANAKKADRVSYVWDRLIEYFTELWQQGEVETAADSAELERCLRVMAETDRLARRALGRMIATGLESTSNGPRFLALMDKEYEAGRAYGVVIAPPPPGLPYAQYRDGRRRLMAVYGRSLRLRHPALSEVLLVGTEPQNSGNGGSEDLVLMTFEDWSEELESETQAAMKELGLGADGRHFVEHQFPIDKPPQSREAKRRLRQMAQRKSKD